ncbi:neurexin-3b-alpha [Plakobranchus ocellatus]|uniref:Neurexin-3b-alpha n=1 Tax=Plakobranchus ocellatus TaxID=259542 RepID=A0AAV4B9F9_9GAST|nr:neurexin-3b-alpha [Plakobranchus ocellatus]
MVNLEGVGRGRRTRFVDDQRTSMSYNLGLSIPPLKVSSANRPGRHAFLMSLGIFLCLLIVPGGQALRFLGQRETYAKFPKWDACDNATIMFQFKTSEPNGLLMYTDDSGRYNYLQVSKA